LTATATAHQQATIPTIEEKQMSIRKRVWTTRTGERKESWIADYFDGTGRRHQESFTTKGAAVAHLAQTTVDLRSGKHVVTDGKLTVADAAERWLEHLKGEGRERTTTEGYETHLRLHILPVLGRVRMAKLNHQVLENFRVHLLNELDANGQLVRSRNMASRVWSSLRMMLRYHRMAHLADGIKGITLDSRHKPKLEVGVDIPINAEVKRLYEATAGTKPRDKRNRALICVLTLCGLRASELRGLRWEDVRFKEQELHIVQRADCYRQIGPPKSASSRRTVPLLPETIQALREWRLAQRDNPELVFATRGGRVPYHVALTQSLDPVLRAADLFVAGKRKYSLHSFRHFFASWCINPVDRGGRGLSAKVVQTWLGHSTVAMTLDTYGHLFREIDRTEAESASAALLQ
jgi:integrase